ncbi:hypothetical protein [Paenibacillus popilliae]|uniref:Uncharacterized protein conserved in bacteria n=1 Tax=Paenibacillus popilliae ATCC 14706 TaxID=1212764 RepID=M9LMD5_PAEPP|nr:hypothetical protein [Paenibacillus popilliae]GAC41286.1 uncharacterized protein conserved in bacteria [Paenibacillus popilliae ATCC 14706]
MTKIKMELVTSEVELARAALRLRALDASQPSVAAYERMANGLDPIGLYEFRPLEAACISVSLLEFSELSSQIGLTELARRSMVLSDDFLWECFLAEPLEEAEKLLDQAFKRRREGVQGAARTAGFVSRFAAIVGITRTAAGNQMRPL